MRYTLSMPYSTAKIYDFGKSSQEITLPSFSARARNARVRLEVEVLSISKIPIMDFSRTAISLPIDKYTTNHSHSVGEGQCPSLNVSI